MDKARKVLTTGLAAAVLAAGIASDDAGFGRCAAVAAAIWAAAWACVAAWVACTAPGAAAAGAAAMAGGYARGWGGARLGRPRLGLGLGRLSLVALCLCLRLPVLRIRIRIRIRLRIRIRIPLLLSRCRGRGAWRGGARDGRFVAANTSPRPRGEVVMALRRHRRMERNLSVSRVFVCVCPEKLSWRWNRWRLAGFPKLSRSAEGARKPAEAKIMNNARKLLTTGLIAAVFGASIAIATPVSARGGGRGGGGFGHGGMGMHGGWGHGGLGMHGGWGRRRLGPRRLGSRRLGPAAGVAAVGAAAVWAMPATAAAGAATGAAAGAATGVGPTMTSATAVVVRAAAVITEPVTEPMSRARRLERRRLELSGPASATAPVGGRTGRARDALSKPLPVRGGRLF